MSGQTRQSLSQLARPLRRVSRAGWGTLALGAALILLGAFAWTVRLGWFTAPWWVFVAWSSALAAAAVLVALARRSDGLYSISGIAGWLEDRGLWRRGALTSLLEAPAGGTSEPLLSAADAGRSQEIRNRGAEAVGPVERPVRRRGPARAAGAVLGLRPPGPVGRPVRRRALAGAAVLLIGLGTLGSAGPRTGTAAALWHPARAWEMTTAPVRIWASATEIDRGDSVRLELEAIGRRNATLWTRTPGESWRPNAVHLDSLGRAVRTIGPLSSDLHARLTSGTRSSDTVLVHVRLPVFLGSLEVTARYPRYLGLEDEPVPTSGDTIIIPAGTRLSSKGSATAMLRSAVWRGGERVHELAVDGTGFSGDFTPSGTSVYELGLVTGEGAPLGGDTIRLPVRVVPDSPPAIEPPVPGPATIPPLSMRLGLVIGARGDPRPPP